MDRWRFLRRDRKAVRRRLQADARFGLGGTAEQRADDSDLRLEPIESLPDRREVDPERLVLPGMPSGADPEHIPAARHVVQRQGLPREDGRMAEGRGQHGLPDQLARYEVGDGRQRGEGLEARAAAVLARQPEMVVHPSGVEDFVAPGLRPGGFEGRPVDVLQ